jgi:fatty acid desaturase
MSAIPVDRGSTQDAAGSNAFLSLADTEALRQRSSLMGAYLVLHAWALIFSAMAFFALWPNPLSFLIAVVVIGNRQLGLAILMHEASHRLLFAQATLNDRVGAWLCGAPVGASLRLYRPYHLSHHRHTQQEQDPDLSLSAPFPITRSSFRRKVMRDLLGVTGFQRRVAQCREAMGTASGPLANMAALWRNERAFLLSNVVLLAVLSAAGAWWLYLLLWVLPLLTWYQLISRLRNIAEHAVVGPADDPLRNTRTTLANPLMRLVLAPYWVNYHLEHHLFVYTPCWKLARAHRLLRDQGLLPRMEVADSYVQVLRAATSAAPGSQARSNRPRGVSRL